MSLDLDNMQKYAIIFIVKKLQMRRRVSKWKSEN